MKSLLYQDYSNFSGDMGSVLLQPKNSPIRIPDKDPPLSPLSRIRPGALEHRPTALSKLALRHVEH